MVKPNKDVIKGKPVFVKIEKFYEILHELMIEMLECRKVRDYLGMLDTFEDIYILVYPFIEQHMTPADVEQIDEMEDVLKLVSGMKPGDNDFILKKNQDVAFQVIRLINQKRKRLSKLIAKSGIYMLIGKHDDHIPAALAGDDYVIE